MVVDVGDTVAALPILLCVCGLFCAGFWDDIVFDFSVDFAIFLTALLTTPPGFAVGDIVSS